MKRKSIVKTLISRLFSLYLPLAFFLIVALFPLYWMIISSLKSGLELQTGKNPLWVISPTLEHYYGLLFQTKFPFWIKNSLVIGVAATICAVAISTLAAYAIARLQFRGKWLISRSVLFSYLMPRTILFIPLFGMLQLLALTDTRMGLVMSYLTFMVPFCTWLLIGYFAALPKEIEECAKIDGCNTLQIIWRIIFPLAAPGIITATLFSFTHSWNEFLYPLVFNSKSANQVVPVGLSDLQMGDIIIWGKIMAAGVLFSLPLVIIYTFIQRYLVDGLTAGSVKG